LIGCYDTLQVAIPGLAVMPVQRLPPTGPRVGEGSAGPRIHYQKFILCLTDFVF
jgi:hypothetical protein